MAVYEAPSSKFDPLTADQQKLVGAVGVDLSAGQTLWLPLPACYYQVDVFCGDVIKHLSATNLYGSRLISSVAGGTKPCAPPTTTTTSTSIPKTTTTTAAPHVAAPVTTTTTEAPELTSQGLAFTGSNLVVPGIVVAVLLSLIGSCSLLVRRLRA